eukprot:7070056-Prymnesium_polylepis.1
MHRQHRRVRHAARRQPAIVPHRGQQRRVAGRVAPPRALEAAPQLRRREGAAVVRELDQAVTGAVGTHVEGRRGDCDGREGEAG